MSKTNLREFFALAKTLAARSAESWIEQMSKTNLREFFALAKTLEARSAESGI